MGGPSPGSFRILASLLIVALLASGCSLLPDLKVEEEGAPPLAQTSKIYDADGRLITTLHAEEDRVPISIRQIPQSVQDAVVAIEDQRFWTHRGIDLRAVLRAAYVNATSGEVVEGGSTITQQYVRNVFPSVGTEQTIGRKLREAALAWQLEEEYSKREILGKYLNTVYFGEGAYGIQRAAKTFYSKPAWELTLAESALLAGLIAGPARYDPMDDRSTARERRDLVLARMMDLGMISPRRYDRAASTSLGLDPKQERDQYPAAYFVEHVKRLILDNPRFGTPSQRYDFLFKGGLRIYTTIDLEMQRLAEQAVNSVLSEPGDPHGALTAIDPRNGHIRAMVGGRNYFNEQSRFAKVNLATGQGGTGRQAGSAFKPFALVAALEQGILPSKTYVASAGSVFTEPPCGSPERPWNVENYEGSTYGTMSMESATISSVNQVYAQIIAEVGPANVVDVAKRMGIRSRLRPYCSSVLGTNEVNTLEMASAFGTLAMNGRHVRPIAIERIEDSTGKVVYEPRPVRRQVINPQVAWIATQILQKVVTSGTGTRANLGDRQEAGKTGTAQMWRDAWFAGYVAQLSAAVWVGHPQGQISMIGTRMGNVVGGSFPALIWATFLRSVIANMHFPVREFRPPPTATISVPIDVTQGCVAVQGVTPPENIQYRDFVPGTQPAQCAAAATSSVPSVVGMTASTAYSILTNAGFDVSQSLRETQAYPSGTVLGQSPAPGTAAAAGTTVSIVVAA